MKKKLTLLLALTTGLGAFTNAYALPTIYPDSSVVTLLSTIKNPTNSNLVADTVDPRVVYVMPPTTANSTVGGLHTITANVGFCHEMSNIAKYNDGIAATMAKLTQDSVIEKKEVEKARVRWANAVADLASQVSTTNMEDYNNIVDRIDVIESSLKALLDRLNTCTQSCTDIRNQIADLRKERTDLTQQKREIATTRIQDARAYEKKKNTVQGYADALAVLTSGYQTNIDKLKKMHADFYSMYSNFASMEGARASLSFVSNWDTNIQSLKDNNPNFDFKKMVTKDAVISSNIVDLQNIPTTGAILGYEIAGNYQNGNFTLTSYPENLSGNVRLSLIGTCPILHPDWFDVSLPNGTDKMKYAITVGYQYPSAFSYKVKMKYNMYKMYQKIVSSGSSGGFFSSRSWSAVEEKTFFRDSFTTDWTEQDLVAPLAQDFKDKLEVEMRNRILGRLATIALPVVANAGQLVDIPALSKSGAVVLSESLMKTCPGNEYCVGGAIALNVLQSIFGSSSSSASYTNIQDVDLIEEWSTTHVQYMPWTTSYN